MKRTSGMKKGNFSSASGLSLGSQGAMTKTIKFGQTKYTARHVILEWTDVESKTVAHHLNTRSQESLDSEAVRDIYKSVLEEGVKQEGIAYYNKQLDRYEIIDASRRRLCAIAAKVSLPLWVLDNQPSSKDIRAYVDLTQTVKRFSWREVGLSYLNYAKEQGIDSTDFDALANEFGVSKETIRKKVNAARINEHIVKSFPDCEAIPTPFYSKLGKIEVTLNKLKIDIRDFVEDAMKGFDSESGDVADIQKVLLTHYESQLALLLNSKPKSKGREEALASFSDPKQYARIKTSADGRRTTLEFSRLPKSIMEEIELLVKQKLSESV